MFGFLFGTVISVFLDLEENRAALRIIMGVFEREKKRVNENYVNNSQPTKCTIL